MDIQYPVYEVITPQTGFTFKIRTMTLNDEMKLRTSIMTNRKSVINEFNQVLWNLIQEKPEVIKDYKTFVSSLTVTDRKALVLGTYHISYGDEFSVTTTCPVCGSTNINNINLLKHTIVNPYQGKEPAEILMKSVSVNLPISKITVELLPPTLEKEMKVSSVQMDSKLAELSMIVDTMTVEKKILTLDKQMNDIISMLKILPAKDTKTIQQKYLETFGNYDVSVKFKVVCSNCSNEYEAEADFMEQLFRMVVQ